MFVAFVFLHHVVVLKAKTYFKVVRTAFFCAHRAHRSLHAFKQISPFSLFSYNTLALSRPPFSHSGEPPQKIRLSSPNLLHYCLTPAPIFTTKAEDTAHLTHHSSAFYPPLHVLASTDFHVPPPGFIGTLHPLLQAVLHLSCTMRSFDQHLESVHKR